MSERCEDFGNYTPHDYGFVLSDEFMNCFDCPNEIKVPCLYKSMQLYMNETQWWIDQTFKWAKRSMECQKELTQYQSGEQDV